MMTIEQAMAKATKLLRLAESSNANEAAVAAQMAQAILTRYQIDAAALAVDGGDDAPAEEVRRDHEELEQGTVRMATWRVSLAHHVALANSCRAFQNVRRSYAGTRSSIMMVGRASDVAKLRYMYLLLCSEVDRLAAQLARGQGRGYANSFRIGVVAAIGDKLKDARDKVAAEMRAEHAGNAQALVRVDKALARIARNAAEVDEFVDLTMRLSSRSAGGASDAEGRAAGYAAGQGVNVGGGARGALGAGQGKLSA